MSGRLFPWISPQIHKMRRGRCIRSFRDGGFLRNRSSLGFPDSTQESSKFHQCGNFQTCWGYAGRLKIIRKKINLPQDTIKESLRIVWVADAVYLGLDHSTLKECCADSRACSVTTPIPYPRCLLSICGTIWSIIRPTGVPSQALSPCRPHEAPCKPWLGERCDSCLVVANQLLRLEKL